MTPSVDIVIVNWNAGTHLRSCLESIARVPQDTFTITNITVVDNASHDGSANQLGDIEIPIEVVRNERNLGFAAGCNQGAKESDADYLLFLNPDARLLPDTLAKVIEFMEGDSAESIGICGVQLVDRHGEPTVSCSRFPTLRVVVGKMTGLDRVLPPLFPQHHLESTETRTSRVVDQVIGAFYFVRRELFVTLDGFDVRYFVYFEEVDFAVRALRRGSRTYFLKEALAFHEGNVSSDQVPATRLYYSLRSRQLFARRYWPRWQAALLLGLTFSVELAARLIRAAFRRDGSEISATLAGYVKWAHDLLGSTSVIPHPSRTG